MVGSRTALTSLVVFVACSSPKRDAYREIAEKANWELEHMRLAAAAVLAARPDDHATIITACGSVDDSLKPLRWARFDDPRLDVRGDGMDPSRPADALLVERCLFCRSHVLDLTRMESHRLERCAKFCRDNWKALIESVERVREAARAEGIEIVSLKP